MGVILVIFGGMGGRWEKVRILINFRVAPGCPEVRMSPPPGTPERRLVSQPSRAVILLFKEATTLLPQPGGPCSKQGPRPQVGSGVVVWWWVVWCGSVVVCWGGGGW